MGPYDVTEYDEVISKIKNTTDTKENKTRLASPCALAPKKFLGMCGSKKIRSK